MSQEEIPTLELNEICFGYSEPGGSSEVPVLNGVDLTVRAGEGVAIMGPSGCGKSTLLQIVGSLLSPQTGTVLYRGTNLAQMPEKARCHFRNQKLGFVFQSHRLLAQCSALENVLIPTIPFGTQSGREATEQRARDLLNRVGLGARLDHRPHELSVGERQRVAVARSLINGPELVLADEPTGALDHNASATLMDLISELRQELRLSVVMVTHSPDIAAAMDRILVLQSGRLQEA